MSGLVATASGGEETDSAIDDIHAIFRQHGAVKPVAAKQGAGGAGLTAACLTEAH